MNIEKVRIKNFRNYLGEHEIDLSKKITILYGPNGFGKSSFFDAIEWCLTGTISRFSDNGEFGEKDVISHYVDLQNAECCVEIDFLGNTLTRKFKVENSIPGYIQVKIITSDGKEIKGREKVDQYLRHQYFKESNDTSLFGGLIKQSHILSQDQVTDFILRDDPKDRFNSLADIMGLKNVLYMLDNVKEVLSKMKSKKAKLEDEIANLLPMIQMRKKDLLAIDSKKVTEFAEDLNVLPKIDSIYESISGLRTNFINQINDVSNQLVLYKKFSDLGFKTLKEAKDKLENLEQSLKSVDSTIDGLKKLKNRIISLQNKISGRRDLFERTKKVNDDIKLKQSILNEMGFEKNFDVKVIETRLNEKRELLARLEYTISYRKEYGKLRKDRENHPIEIEELKRKANYLTKRISRIEKLLSKIEALLNDNENGVIVKLLENIRGIFEYIQENDTAGHCPVCSSYHGENLIECVQNNLETNKDKLRENAAYTQKLISIKSRMDNRLTHTERDLGRINSEINKLTIQLNSARNRFQSIVENELFDSNLFHVKSEEELNRENSEARTEINSLEKALTTFRMLQHSIQELTSLTEEIGTEKFDNLSDLSMRQVRLERAQNRVDNIISKKQSSKNTIKQQYESLYKEVTLIPNHVLVNELNSPIALLVPKLQERKTKLEEKLNYAVNFKQTVEHNNKVSRDIKNLESQRDSLQINLDRYQDKIKSIEMFVQNAGALLGSTAKDFLNTPHSAIQKYYRYLNPLPTTTPVRFEGENGELQVMVPVEKKENGALANAQYTLSSGQLNVLAIAIFLAINDSQRVSKLDFVAIDDPIQNMDDVNQFSICDVLGGLNKQLIFSTHDFNFVKLFMKKNEHQKNDIQLYVLGGPRLSNKNIKRLVFDS